MANVKWKWENVAIETLGDACALFNHNFEVVERTIRKVAKSNRKLKILSAFAVGCALYATAKYRKQEEELYQLSIRVKKLENQEGA